MLLKKSNISGRAGKVGDAGKAGKYLSPKRHRLANRSIRYLLFVKSSLGKQKVTSHKQYRQPLGDDAGGMAWR
jgi:hypothetical protein